MNGNPPEAEPARIESQKRLTSTQRLYLALHPIEGQPLLHEMIVALDEIPLKQAQLGARAALNIALYFPLSLRRAMLKGGVPLIAFERMKKRNKIGLMTLDFEDGFLGLGAYAQEGREDILCTSFGVNEQGDVRIEYQEVSGAFPTSLDEASQLHEREGKEPFSVILTDRYELNKAAGKIRVFLNTLEEFGPEISQILAG